MHSLRNHHTIVSQFCVIERTTSKVRHKSSRLTGSNHITLTRYEPGLSEPLSPGR